MNINLFKVTVRVINTLTDEILFTSNPISMCKRNEKDVDYKVYGPFKKDDEYPILGIYKSSIKVCHHFLSDYNNNDDYIYQTDRENKAIVFTYNRINPRNDEEERILLNTLSGEDPKYIREKYPNAVYVVTRSYSPDDKTPWVRLGKHTYQWLVSLEDRDLNKGRRIEWDYDTMLYKNRKDALNAMYNQ